MPYPEVGVFAVDKPQSFTSFDVVAKLRGLLGIRRIGHGGTLDPLATGVLPIFIGKATKAVDRLEDNSKRYTATAVFGRQTDTGDITGETIERSNGLPEKSQLQEVIESFVGPYEQIPPMYSALKVNGRPLYDIARAGGMIEREPRSIEILSMKLLVYDTKQQEFTIDVCCSKGTYIRTLVEDIAKGCLAVATLSRLRRTKSGPFTEGDCLSLDEIEVCLKSGDRSFIQPVDRLFTALERVTLTEQQYMRFMNGASITVDTVEQTAQVGVYYQNSMIAVACNACGKLKTVARFV
ncbi:MAG: tRNA pseudouridine(55) synthase TruB [Oscillospiraceae bacterium]|nr:tRNA pseudouridine(55) synthase TruB [Oscillospiraceae bacterium]